MQSEVTSIDNLKVMLNSSEINWLKVINFQLPSFLHCNGSEPIEIKYKNLVIDRLIFLSKIEKR